MAVSKVQHLRLVMTLATSSVILLSLIAPVGMANAMPTHKVEAKSFLNNRNVPHDSVLILDINYKVTNDEDSGFSGYWALDDYEKHIQIWKVPDGSFYAVVTYEGKFHTFAGALSPQNGVTETKDATGEFNGGYVATFRGTFSPALATRGYVGTFDFGGTKADILLGTYGNGQTGSTTPFSYLGSYFKGVDSFNEDPWGWTYQYKNQTWKNLSVGSSGDIMT